MGLGFVQHYLKNGWQVFATHRTLEKNEVFQKLKADYGDRYVALQLDVMSESSINEMVEHLVERKVSLNLLINNAGVSIEEDFGQWTASVFEMNLWVNSIGPALVAQALVPLMSEEAKLVNISSGMGSLELNVNPDNGLDAYAMSKAALDIMTRRLAAKLKPQGIVVVALNPGWVKTEMGGAEAPSSIDEAIDHMTEVIEGLTLEQTDRFYADNGETLPW